MNTNECTRAMGEHCKLQGWCSCSIVVAIIEFQSLATVIKWTTPGSCAGFVFNAFSSSNLIYLLCTRTISSELETRSLWLLFSTYAVPYRCLDTRSYFTVISHITGTYYTSVLTFSSRIFISKKKLPSYLWPRIIVFYTVFNVFRKTVLFLYSPPV